MLAKCANPECSQIFRYLGAGKLYRHVSQGSKSQCGGLEHFWLCPECVGKVTVAVERSGRVIVIERTMLASYRDTVGRLTRVPEITAAQLAAGQKLRSKYQALSMAVAYAPKTKGRGLGIDRVRVQSSVW